MRTLQSIRLSRHHALTFTVLLGFIVLAACDANTGPQANTGRVAFKAVFAEPRSESGLSRAASDIDACSDYGIQTIRAMIIDPGGTSLGEHDWPCDSEGHRGTMDQIRPGTGYRIVVEGHIGGIAQWHGEITGINVTAGRTTNAGIVEMIRVGQFPIVATTGSGGSIAPSGTVGVDPGGTQTFTITPAPNYQILDVKVDGMSLGALATYTFADVDGAHTIRATFAPPAFTVTASAGVGGHIDPAGSQTVYLGDSSTFTITADPGFYLSAVLVNGASQVPRNPFVLTDISADTTVQAEFSVVVFVDAGAPAGGDGSSWALAFNDLQAAVDASSGSGDIWMKSGTYRLANQIAIDKTVHIYGGFQGNETLLEARDPTLNATIIDGGLKTRCLFITADTVLDGLSIRNGRPATAPIGQGGGAYIDSAAPRLVDCTFINNALDVASTSARGGALYINGGSPIIENCLFENNLTSNAAQPSEGGAIFNNSGFPTVSKCTFIGNRAPGSDCAAGAIYNQGGGATIAGCRFISNDAGQNSSAQGGAIFNSGGLHTISGSFFQDNLAEGPSLAHGGAIYNNSATLTLTNTIFLDNEARHESSGSGGAIYNNNSDPFITNCTFYANRAVGTATAYGIAGAIFNLDSRPTVVNSIVWGNQADQGVAIFNDGTSLTGINSSDTDMSNPGGTGNINVDPLLDAQGHLRPKSPCIKAGDDTAAPRTDIDGETRPQGARSDIGADEFVDSDGDGMPDYWEITYGLDTDSADGSADLDGDGATNGFEYRFDLDPSETNPVLAASHRGNYLDNGDHDQNDDSTPVGRLAGPTHRAYFIFPLTGVSDPVTAAILRLEVVNAQSSQATNDLDLYAVSTDPATLEQSASGQTGIFDDLGTGTRYKRLAVGPGNVGQILEIALPQSALSDINAKRGGSFPVGLDLTVFGVVSTEFITFSTGTEARVHQLVLKTD